VPPTFIIALRHGEKPANAERKDKDKPLDERGAGFDQTGAVDRHGLTVQGWQRACGLATTKLCASLPAHAHLGRTPVFVPDYDGEPEKHRAYQTVLPYARLWADPDVIDHPCNAAEVDKLQAAVMAVDGVAVVCWEHDALAEFARVVLGEKVDWPKGRFDVLWLLHPTGGGWELDQVDQRLVWGDAGLPPPPG